MSNVNAPAFQIKVTLKDIDPPIWRRILVSCETTLSQLHDIIQAAMGWQNSHVHLFEIGIVRFTSGEDPENLTELTAVDSRCVRLLHLVQPYHPFRGDFHFAFDYEYDMGDSWHHEVVFEDVLPPDPKRKTPVCTGGERACPPEDVGGVHGYVTFLEAIRNPDDPEHQSYLEWIGGSFDPEAFSIEAINQQLRGLR
jgi:Plasmid pRiA4b ORF-3-like protein